MLKKLLHYDLKPIFKYWWIAALTSFAISLLGGGSITVIRGGDEPPVLVFALAVITLMLTILCNAAFMILSEILAYLRYYRNFYTDEGYLTFTLPVKTTTLIHSKLLMATITMGATFLVMLINVITMLLIGFGVNPAFWKELLFILSELWSHLGAYLILYVFLGILLSLAFFILSNLLIFCCITIAALLAKKAKVFCAIALIYASSGVISAVIQLFGTLALYGAYRWVEDIPEYAINPLVSVGLLGLIAFVAALATLCYLGHYRMIDRKLNLS